MYYQCYRGMWEYNGCLCDQDGCCMHTTFSDVASLERRGRETSGCISGVDSVLIVLFLDVFEPASTGATEGSSSVGTLAVLLIFLWDV